MTIKRKTQLNLSGSHRNLDADIAWVGSNLYVTGSSEFTGSAHFQQITGSISGTLGGLPFIVAGPNITASYNDSTGQWAITGSSGGSATPAGADRTVQFNNDGVFAGDVDFQFYSNSLGDIGANTLAFWTGSVGVLSGALTSSGTVLGDIGYNGNILKINTNVLVTQSAMLFDGVGSAFDLGGVLLANGAKLTMFSGSLGEDPPFDISPSDTPDQVFLRNVGTAKFVSGAVNLTDGSNFTVFSGSNGGEAQFTVGPSFTSGKVDASLNGAMTITSGSLYVNAGSSSDSSFQIEPIAPPNGQVNVIFDRTGSTGGVNFQGINVRPQYATMTTSGSAGTIMSGTLLMFGPGSYNNNTIGKIDFNVIAVGKDTDNYGSWTFSATVARKLDSSWAILAATELDSVTSGSNIDGWDVNVDLQGGAPVIYCTGSAGAEIQWYAHVTKKMFLSGSGLITY